MRNNSMQLAALCAAADRRAFAASANRKALVEATPRV